MGKPTELDHSATLLIWCVALFCISNGLFMLIAPGRWYELIPTASATGPANLHFIVDIGLTYLCSGVLLIYAARYVEGRWLALVAGALWLSTHALFHIYEIITRMCTIAHFFADLPGVLMPPLLLWLALGILCLRQRIAPAGLPKSALISVSESIAPGETGYLRALAAAPGHAFEKFAHFMPATMHRHTASADIFHLARIGATLEEDCGPCAMIAARGALADGVSPDLINDALRGGQELAGNQRTAFMFGQSVAQHAAEAFTLGDELEQRFGRVVRLELAMTAALVRGYPAFKRGLGLSKSCATTPLRV